MDSKCDGFDLSDQPLQGIKAELSSNTIENKFKMQSDAQGILLFGNLPYGTYSLKLTASKGYAPTQLVSSYEIGEVNAAVSDIFVFCKK